MIIILKICSTFFSKSEIKMNWMSFIVKDRYNISTIKYNKINYTKISIYIQHNFSLNYNLQYQWQNVGKRYIFVFDLNLDTSSLASKHFKNFGGGIQNQKCESMRVKSFANVCLLNVHLKEMIICKQHQTVSNVHLLLIIIVIIASLCLWK